MRTVLRYLPLLLVFLTNACTTVVQGEMSQVYSPIAPHVKVTVVNNCSPTVDIELGGGVVKAGLKYGESFTVFVTRQAFVSQYGTERMLIVKAMLGETYLGSSTRRYYIDASRSGYEEVWEVDNVRTANGVGGCRV